LNGVSHLDPLGAEISDASREEVNVMKRSTKETSPDFFWLTTTIDSCTPDVTKEVSEVKLYTKWSLFKPEFFKLTPKEQVKRLKDDMLVFEPELFPTAERKTKDLNVLVEDSKFMLKGVFFNSLDDGSFPVNPRSVVKNEVPGSQKIIPHLCWLKLHPKESCMECQLTLTVTVYSRFDIQVFPFDQHVIPIALHIKRPYEDADRVKRAWYLTQDKPEWAPEGWQNKNGQEDPTELVHVVANTANNDPHSDIKHSYPTVYRLDRGKLDKEIPLICVRIYRDPTHVIISAAVPIFCIGLMCISSFFLRFNDADRRVSATGLSILSLASYTGTLHDIIPSKSYLTYADQYIYLGFAFFAMLTIKVSACPPPVPGRAHQQSFIF
jgi:hypothetical protein